MVKPLNATLKKILLDFFINKEMLAIHLINYIDLNGHYVDMSQLEFNQTKMMGKCNRNQFKL
jgi:hypothetical protein